MPPRRLAGGSPSASSTPRNAALETLTQSGRRRARPRRGPRGRLRMAFSGLTDESPGEPRRPPAQDVPAARTAPRLRDQVDPRGPARDGVARRDPRADPGDGRRQPRATRRRSHHGAGPRARSGGRGAPRRRPADAPLDAVGQRARSGVRVRRPRLHGLRRDPGPAPKTGGAGPPPRARPRLETKRSRRSSPFPPRGGAPRGGPPALLFAEGRGPPEPRLDLR